jgi:serine protease inhibitor
MGWVKKLWLSISYTIKPKFIPCIGKYEEKCVQYIMYQNRPSAIDEGLYH